MSSKLVACIGGLGLLAAGLSVQPALAKAGDFQDSEQVSKLLSEAKTMAFQLKEDAETMESFAWMNVSWQSHAAAINLIREHVKALGKQATKLSDAKGIASPWQEIAIDRITPYLDEMNGYTAAVIEHLNGDKKRNVLAYNDYLEAIADYAADLAALIGDFVDYGNARQRTGTSGAALEVSPFAKSARQRRPIPGLRFGASVRRNLVKRNQTTLPFEILETEARSILSPVSGFLAEAGFTHSSLLRATVLLTAATVMSPPCACRPACVPTTGSTGAPRTTFKSNAAELLCGALFALTRQSIARR